MTDRLKLMCVFAHPDDESMGTGGTLAKYAAEGVEISLLCATRGERGWGGLPEDFPGMQEFGKIREAELHAAASVLGLKEVVFLDYIDGDLDRAEPQQVVSKIAHHLRRVKPQVVVTFGPEGAYGHPDHIAISQFTSAAVLCAADPDYLPPNGALPHRVSKLYYAVDSKELVEVVRNSFGVITMDVDGVKRVHTGWEDWAISTRVDATIYWRQAWEAVTCHKSQLNGMLEALEKLPPETHQNLWGKQSFYRAYSLVNGGRKVERDLFEGLR